VHLYISCSGVLPAGTPFYSSVTQNGSSNGPQKYKDRYIPPTYSPIELPMPIYYYFYTLFLVPPLLIFPNSYIFPLGSLAHI